MNQTYSLGIHILTENHDLTLTDHMNLIRQIGWDGCTMMWNPEKTEIAANTAAKLGLYLQSVHSPFSKVRALWEDTEESEPMRQTLLNCIDDCANYDIPIMVIHPFIGFNCPYVPTKLGLDRFGSIIEHAEKKGIKLAFENVEGEPYLDAIFEAYSSSPYVGFCYDTGHQLCYNENRDVMAKYGHRLFHTHLNDNLGQRGEKIDHHDDLHLPMGDGVADWKRIMDSIRSSGYRDMLICELSITNKRNGHELDRYIAMSMEEFYAYALEAARRVTSL